VACKADSVPTVSGCRVSRVEGKRMPGFQPGSQHARFETLARSEFETFRCTVFFGLFKRAAFGIAPYAFGTYNGLV
jgi:hypothetical protein